MFAEEEEEEDDDDDGLNRVSVEVFPLPFYMRAQHAHSFRDR